MLLTICIIGGTFVFGSTLAYFMCGETQRKDISKDKYMDDLEDRMSDNLFIEKE
ncbi:MAG: hypothetical protein JRJ85_26525 [Deltaproteobacteria bacterium]|nr:hypothetical protein [Deltaproteobacteria bacterium]